MDRTTDLYATLGVEPGASREEIKRNYRKLAKKYHPDSNDGCKKKEAKFKEISTAYDILSDDKKRTEYDSYRNGGFAGGQFSGGGPGFDISSLFSQMFSGAGGRGPEPGGPTGGMFGDDIFGPGNRRVRRRANPVPEAPRETTIRASDGSPLTLRGADTYADLRVGLDEAILGTVKEVATLQGTAKIKVPPGTSSGSKLRLKGRGKAGQGGQPGNHYATIHIDVPRDLSEEARELLIQFVRQTRTKR